MGRNLTRMLLLLLFADDESELFDLPNDGVVAVDDGGLQAGLGGLFGGIGGIDFDAAFVVVVVVGPLPALQFSVVIGLNALRDGLTLVFSFCVCVGSLELRIVIQLDQHFFGLG